MGYSRFLPQSAPPWLQDTNGTAFLGAIGAAVDDSAADLKSAVKQRFPRNAFGDALPAISSERGIDRGAFDTDASFAARLSGAWATWGYAGSGYSILSALAVEGYTATNGSPVLVAQSGLYQQLDAAGNLVVGNLSANLYLAYAPPYWTTDGNAARWARFWLLFPSLPSGWTNVQATPTSSTAPTLSEVNTIRRIVNKWRAAKALWLGTIVVTSGKVLGWPVDVLGVGHGVLGASSAVRWGAQEQ